MRELLFMIWGISFLQKKSNFLFLILALFHFLYPIQLHARKATINIFSSQNGKGLENSRKILKNALLEDGHTVFEKEYYEKPLQKDPHVDINIFFEILNPDWFATASANWFILNPECYEQDVKLFDKIDLFLCRTQEVERIVKAMNKKTYFLSFSSNDSFLPNIEKDFSLAFHLAGGSSFKGTNAVVNAWENEGFLPHLILIVHYDFPHIISQHNVEWIRNKIPLNELQNLRNRSGIHLCLSETEGFGHSIMEAMSTAAVVITTDAPPMNEFIVDKRCLVPYFNTAPCRLGIRYFADPDQLKITVQNLMQLSTEELREIGEKNRLMYLQKTDEFRKNLQKLLKRELSKKKFKNQESDLLNQLI